jgi:hypothetical protein
MVVKSNSFGMALNKKTRHWIIPVWIPSCDEQYVFAGVCGGHACFEWDACMAKNEDRQKKLSRKFLVFKKKSNFAAAFIESYLINSNRISVKIEET